MAWAKPDRDSIALARKSLTEHIAITQPHPLTDMWLGTGPAGPPTGWHQRATGAWVPDWLRGIRLSKWRLQWVATGRHPCSGLAMVDDGKTCSGCLRRVGPERRCDDQGPAPRDHWPACRAVNYPPVR